MAEKGRKQILFIIIMTFVIEILSTIINLILYSRNGNADQFTRTITSGIVRMILTIILMTFLYKGNNTAKVITQILTLLAAIFGIITFFILLAVSYLAYVLLILALIEGSIFLLLASSTGIHEYISEKTKKRLEEENKML